MCTPQMFPGHAARRTEHLDRQQEAHSARPTLSSSASSATDHRRPNHRPRFPHMPPLATQILNEAFHAGFEVRLMIGGSSKARPAGDVDVCTVLIGPDASSLSPTPLSTSRTQPSRAHPHAPTPSHVAQPAMSPTQPSTHPATRGASHMIHTHGYPHAQIQHRAGCARGHPDLIVCVLPFPADDIRRAVKHFGDVSHGITTQCLVSLYS